jgi:cyclohexyl-isocyanide hydratase
MTSDSHSLVVGFPLYDGVNALDFIGATEVFADTGGSFTPIWLAAEKRNIRTAAGNYVYPNYCFIDKHPAIDILFIPGGRGVDMINNAMFDQTYQDFIKLKATEATWHGSVCVGSFIMAAAGLLNNCRATTHWSQLENLKLLAEKYNLVIPPGYPRGLIDSEHKIFTGGGVSSSIDLALMLIEHIKQKSAAESAQLFIQYAPDPGIHSGDPSQASKATLESVTSQIAPLTKDFFDAVQRLLER